MLARDTALESAARSVPSRVGRALRVARVGAKRPVASGPGAEGVSARTGRTRRTRAAPARVVRPRWSRGDPSARSDRAMNARRSGRGRSRGRSAARSRLCEGERINLKFSRFKSRRAAAFEARLTRASPDMTERATIHTSVTEDGPGERDESSRVEDVGVGRSRSARPRDPEGHDSST